MRILSAATLVVLASAAAAQPTLPPVRAHHSVFYDEVGKRILLTGGSTPLDGGQRFDMFNDLWSFDGKTWTRLPSSGAPMSGMQVAFDSKRNRLVSFGGFDGGPRGDVRVLEHDTWKTLGVHAEMPVSEPGFVYDAKRDRFVAFGGSGGMGKAYSDTWEYDGATWTKLSVAGPPARQAHVMVYDPRRGVTVLFGGMAIPVPGQPPPPLGDTWEFDGAKWMQRATTGPSPRFGVGATYDSKRGRVLVFGGGGTGGKADLWAWDGGAWKLIAEGGPEPRSMGYMAYDKQRDRVVMFGGRKGWPNDLNDTWEFDGSRWRRVE
jgi:hypothetical protein